jgi:hypothetical protein
MREVLSDAIHMIGRPLMESHDIIISPICEFLTDAKKKILSRATRMPYWSLGMQLVDAILFY